MWKVGKAEAEILLAEYPILECDLKQCRNMGVCMSLGKILNAGDLAEQCFCDSGFYGPECQFEVGESSRMRRSNSADLMVESEKTKVIEDDTIVDYNLSLFLIIFVTFAISFILRVVMKK